MAEKKRIEVFSHAEISDEGSANVTATEATICLLEVHGIRGTIQLYNSGSTSVTVKTWISNYKICGDPVSNPDNWVSIDERAIAAGSKDVIRISGTYRYIAVTAVTASGTTTLKYASYFVMGGV